MARKLQMCKSRFWLLLQVIFLPIKMNCSVNKSDYFVKKIAFCFMAKSKKCHWATLPKMCQKLNFSWKCHFFTLLKKPIVIFFTKKSLFVYAHVKKMPLLAKVEFLAHFWQFFSLTFFWLGQKTKSDFFHKRITTIY